MATQRIGITWQLTDSHGWGVFGTNLALGLVRDGPLEPLLLGGAPQFISPRETTMQALASYFDEGAGLMEQIRSVDRQATLHEVLVLHSLGNQLQHSSVSDYVRGHANVGFVFFEDAALSDVALERAGTYDRIIAGSGWNRDILKRHGLEDVRFVAQGIDTELFNPNGDRGISFQDRFVVFSGGKLELRKGQDIALTAFRDFYARHPDALLMTSWQNSWPETAMNIANSRHVGDAPMTDNGGNLDLTGWAEEHGIPADAFVDLGWISNSEMARTIRAADVAVFTNRCEGGTNLVAMETMACGVPCILSANTGHLDLIDVDNCFPLTDQKEIAYDEDPAGEWRESSVDEVVELLEAAYTDRNEAIRRGAAGAVFISDWSWPNQVSKLIIAIDDLFES